MVSIFNRFSKRIEAQNWDHVHFLRNILLALAFILLFFYIWLFILNLNQFISEIFFQKALNDLLFGNLIGIMTGIVIGFFILLPYYLREEWDLHKVVPAGLFFHLLLSTTILFFNYFSTWQNEIRETAILIGYLIGGLIPILTYAGEVEKEHVDNDDDDEILLLEDE